MNLPGLLVEYLINGSIALVWLLKIDKLQLVFAEIQDNQILIIPIAYVLGMFIDFLAALLVHPFKKLIRRSSEKTVGKEIKSKRPTLNINDYKTFWDEKVAIEKHFPDLNKEIMSRSSRDRIARGTMLNLIPISILYWADLQWVGIILLFISIIMWAKFEQYNRCFEIRSAISIREEKK